MLEAGALLDMAVALFKRYKSLFVILPLATLLALSHCSDKRHTRQRDEARAKIVELETAPKANREAAERQVRELEAKYTEQAKEADRANAKAIEADRPAVVRYIDRWRVREEGLCVSRPAAPAEGPTAPDRDGPGVAPAMVAVRTDEFERLVEQSRRLQQVNAWGLSLIEDGTAEAIKAGVPEPAFGED